MIGSLSLHIHSLQIRLFLSFVIICFHRSSEGKTVEVPYRGDVEMTVLDILGGLRSACTYTGASKLKELPRRATFIRCTQQVNQIYGNLDQGE